MILLSFDIGIKNLAYSVVYIDKASKTLKTIYDWGIVNLLETQQTKSDVCCCAVTRDKHTTVCGNKANRSIGRADKKILICGNKKCEEWVTTRWNQLYPKSKAKLARFKAKKATSFSLIDMATAMKRWIEIKKSEWENQSVVIDTVLLEHQPVFRNPVMKSVQMILVGILVGTGFHTSIQFVHAGRKTKETDSYSARKELSVTMIENMKKDDAKHQLFSQEVWNVWLSSRKRDDLADTINQAVAWYASHS